MVFDCVWDTVFNGAAFETSSNFKLEKKKKFISNECNKKCYINFLHNLTYSFNSSPKIASCTHFRYDFWILSAGMVRLRVNDTTKMYCFVDDVSLKYIFDIVDKHSTPIVTTDGPYDFTFLIQMDAFDWPNCSNRAMQSRGKRYNIILHRQSSNSIWYMYCSMLILFLIPSAKFHSRLSCLCHTAAVEYV